MENAQEDAQEDVQESTTSQEATSCWKRCGSKKQATILTCICMYWFASSCINSMIAPFFPEVGLRKGANNSINGMIFACFPLVISLFSPVIGFLLPKVGPKFIIIAGQFIEGSSQILFGFMDTMPDGNIFLAFCFLVRCTSALGAAASTTAGMLLVSESFPDNISGAVAVIQVFNGLGLMVGPPIGGFLYSVGGFRLPFFVFGTFVLCSIIPMFYVLPSQNEASKRRETWNKAALWHTVCIPALLVVAITVAYSGMVISFLEPSLQKHLAQPFHLNNVQIGFMFLIGPAAYASAAPGTGYLADKWDNRYLLIIGAFISAVGFYLVGPTPSLPFLPKTLWLNGVALAVIGFGMAPFFLPCLSDMLQSASVYGMADDTSTKSAVSALFTGMNSAGQIIGPTLGGILVDHFAFGWASVIFGTLVVFWALFLIAFTYFERKHLRKRKAKESKEAKEVEDMKEAKEVMENGIGCYDIKGNGEKTPLLPENEHSHETIV